MLKLVKWAYDRGVHAERERIKRLIGEYASQAEAERQQMRTYMDKPDREHNEIELETNARVRKTLNKLLEPEFMQEFGIAPIDKENN